jgi:hypothetical protein
MLTPVHQILGTPTDDIAAAQDAAAGLNVDSFKLAGRRVSVEFFDPSPILLKKHPSFPQLSSDEKMRLWDEHLHRTALYAFHVASDESRDAHCFVLRGTPSVTDSSSFYQLEVVATSERPLGNPNDASYEERILVHIPVPGVRGVLFEHMFPPDRRKKVSGAGVLFLGKFARVTPYAEIMAVVSEEIARFFKKRP